MTSTSTRFTGSPKLNVVKTLAGHEPYFEDGPDGQRRELAWGPAISYFPDGQKMISGYGNTARLWDLKESKEIEEARVIFEQRVYHVAVSRDSRWVAVGGENGELKACEVNTGVIKSFKGRSSWIMTMDISRDSTLLVSGSFDGTMQIWDLEIGNLVTSTSIVTVLAAVRFSQDSKKLAIQTTSDFEVWSIEARKLEIKIRKNYSTNSFPVPCQWTTNDRTIVAACPLDSRDRDPKTIYEIDSSTLEIVGVPFQGHADSIHGLELSSDCALLVSASVDNTVKLWAFESRHLLASFDIRDIARIALSPDARQLAYTTRQHGRRRIHICDIPSDVVVKLWPGQEAHGSNVRQNGDPLNFDATACHSAAKQRVLLPAPVAAQQLGRSPSTHQQDFFVLRHIRKLFSRKDAIPAIAVEPCDPLDCPATSPRVSGKPSSVPTTNLMDHSPGSNSGDTLPISQSASRSSSSLSRLRHLVNWRPARHALPAVIDVPLTQGQKRNAAAGAPKRDGRYVRDEDFTSRPTSPVSTFQHPPSGDHGTRSRHLCFCF